MLQIPITGLYSLFAAIHQPTGGVLLYSLQSLVNYNPYVQIYFQ